MIDDLHSTSPATADGPLQARLALAAEAALAHERMLWTVFGLYWLANVGLLMVLFSTGDLPFELISYVVCALGVLLGGVGWLVLAREAAEAARCRNLVDRLDQRLAPEAGLRLAAALGDWRVRSLPQASALVCAAMWLLAFILFVIATQRGGLLG